MEWDQYPTATMKDINKVAFLDFLSKAEGADYNTIVGGSKFDNYDQHPNVVGLTTKEGPSTAAGRYQITGTTYRDLAPKLGITDFSPGSQDKIAMALIDRAGATKDIENGDFNAAISKLGSTWASLPSSPYSQPKKSQGWVNKTLESIVNSMVPAAQAAETPKQQTPSATPTTATNWDSFPTAKPTAAPTSWEMFPAVPQTGSTNEYGTETVPVAPPTEPQASPLAPLQEATAQPESSQQAPQEQAQQPLSFKDEMLRQAGLTGRYALQGAEKAFTFPVRAAGEAGASLLSLAGAPEAGKAVSGAIGFNAPSVGAQAADIAGLPTPQTGLEKTVGAGAEALAGLGVGGVARSVAANAPKAAQEAASALFPTANTAGQAALFGGLGSTMEAAPGTTTAGLAALVAAGAGKKAYQGVRTNSAMSKILENAGGNKDLAKVDSEIITAINKERNSYIRNAGKGAPPLGTKDLNQTVAGKFVREAEDFIGKLPKETPFRSEILDKLRTGANLSTDEVYALRSSKLGDKAADAVEKAQRVYALTAPTEAAGGFIGNAARSLVDAAPVVSSALTGVPIVLPSNVTSGFKRILGGGETRKQAGSSLTGKYPLLAAEKILAEQGPSNATLGMQQIAEMAAKSDKQRLAQEAAALVSKDTATQAGRELFNKTAKDAAVVSRAEGGIGIPQSGAYNKFLEFTGMQNSQAIPMLRKFSKDFKDNEIGKAAKELLQSKEVPNDAGYYAIQNIFKDIAKREGALSPQAGALSQSTIVKPASYAEAVRTAGEAANIARSAAPTPELGQFATSIAGLTKPSDKAKALQERLAAATDQAEIDYLNKFVEPLTKFGKKGK